MNFELTTELGRITAIHAHQRQILRWTNNKYVKFTRLSSLYNHSIAHFYRDLSLSPKLRYSLLWFFIFQHSSLSSSSSYDYWFSHIQINLFNIYLNLYNFRLLLFSVLLSTKRFFVSISLYKTYLRVTIANFRQLFVDQNFFIICKLVTRYNVGETFVQTTRGMSGLRVSLASLNYRSIIFVPDDPYANTENFLRKHSR